jgi:hypothetical protein
MVAAGADLHLEAKVSAPDPMAPLSLAVVTFTVTDSTGAPVATLSVPANNDGVASAALLDLPEGNYTVTTEITGAAFTEAAPAVVDTESKSVSEPVRITDLTARARPGEVQIVWTHVGAYQYIVYRKSSLAPNWTRITSTRSTYSTYLDRGLINDVTYQYCVKPADAEGNELGDSNFAYAKPTARRTR